MKYIDPNYGITWMFIPDDHGSNHFVDLVKPTTNTRQEVMFDDPHEKINFWLYNKNNPTEPLLLKVAGNGNLEDFSLHKAYDGSKQTKFIIHGWKNNLNNDIIQVIKDAYLKEELNYNIIGVDWSEIAADNNYLRSASATKDVGRNVAYVINHMVVYNGAELKNFHIIGHSLGAHTAGYAGTFIKSMRNEKIDRITGLDPAYPLFEDTSEKHRMLDPTDADFVDVIHTCAGILGHDENLGHADFYPNGGEQVQPGCDYLMNDLIGTCSHEKSFKYFAETITHHNKYMAKPCTSWRNFKKNKCSGAKIPMGDGVPRNARGQYYLETETSDYNNDYSYFYDAPDDEIVNFHESNEVDIGDDVDDDESFEWNYKDEEFELN
ncbi:inactive pancreatic lipase-related protein 1 [Chironomus tepperi]|uniref:inactive pancreatic lipase-related protein 1 n=1 Tax=Chironomus tepperi TaxID=113505 RepID=UPI00391FC90B